MKRKEMRYVEEIDGGQLLSCTLMK
jgi:hypothetical protein